MSGKSDEIHRLHIFKIYPVMVTTRLASLAEFELVRDFYAQQGYSQELRPGDHYFLAERGGTLCGICRLCAEHGVLVLRGMRVAP